MHIRRLLMLLTLLLSAAPAVSHAQTWPNEPAGSALKLDCNMTSDTACGLNDVYNSMQPDSDGTAPVSPSGVMRSTIAAGASSGGSEVHWASQTQYAEMYVGMMWRTNPQFFGRTVANKMFFIRGPAVNGFWGLNGCPGQGSSTCYLMFGHNTGSLDNSHACAADLGLICNPNVSSGVVPPLGTWTKLEAYVKKSTTATSRDGTVRWWVNGVLVGNYTNLNYAPSGLDTWVWSETWDGFVNPVPTVAWSHYLDHLRISIPNCGTQNCGVTPPPPGPPPPPPPSPLPPLGVSGLGFGS